MLSRRAHRLWLRLQYPFSLMSNCGDQGFPKVWKHPRAQCSSHHLVITGLIRFQSTEMSFRFDAHNRSVSAHRRSPGCHGKIYDTGSGQKMSTHLGPGITKQRATPPLTTSQVEPAEDKPPKKWDFIIVPVQGTRTVPETGESCFQSLPTMACQVPDGGSWLSADRWSMTTDELVTDERWDLPVRNASRPDQVESSDRVRSSQFAGVQYWLNW